MHLGLRGLLDRSESTALRHAMALREISSRFGLGQMNIYADSILSLIGGNHDNAGWVETYKTFEVGYAGLNARLYLPIFKSLAAWKALATGQSNLGREFAAQARTTLHETQEDFIKSDLLRLESVLALKEGEAKAAEDRLNQAIDVARQQGAKAWELRAAIDLARLWQAQDRIDEAVAVLDPVHQSISEGDCTEDQATARELLAKLAG